MTQLRHADRETGFVLLSVMVILSLFTLLGISQLYRSITIQQESRASVKSMQASYYAETAISYVQWGWANDADFDDGSGATGAANDTTLGDREEWLTAITNPTSVISYWDNGSTGSGTNRAVSWDSSACLPLTSSSPSYCSPTLTAISTDLDSRLNGYIKLEISTTVQSDGTNAVTVTPTLEQNGALPTNGAIVWVTAGDASKDYQVLNAPCTPPATTFGCFNNGTSDTVYHVVAYGLGVVDGKPLHLLRAVIR